MKKNSTQGTIEVIPDGIIVRNAKSRKIKRIQEIKRILIRKWSIKKYKGWLRNNGWFIQNIEWHETPSREAEKVSIKMKSHNHWLEVDSLTEKKAFRMAVIEILNI